jgi:hypothetical protein
MHRRTCLDTDADTRLFGYTTNELGDWKGSGNIPRGEPDRLIKELRAPNSSSSENAGGLRPNYRPFVALENESLVLHRPASDDRGSRNGHLGRWGRRTISNSGPFRCATVSAAENRLHRNPVICWWILLSSSLRDPSWSTANAGT